MTPNAILQRFVKDNPSLGGVAGKILFAYDLIMHAFYENGTLLLAGNGGSCCDAQHIAGELMKGFLLKRPLEDAQKDALAEYGEEGKLLAEKLQGGLPCIVLSDMTGLISAFANDVDAQMVYAQQAHVYAKKGDVFLGISTSGNAKNVYYAAVAAKAKGARVVALTGEGGGKLAEIADILIDVPEKETYRVQEMHLPVYHCLCAMIESSLFDREGSM